VAEASLLQINAFGSPRLSSDDGAAAITLRSRKHLALVIFLAVHQGRAHSRGTLVALLWPDISEDAARNNLRVALADLRRNLGDAAAASLETDRVSVRLRPGGHTLDVTEFEALLAMVRAHSHISIESCDDCIARLAYAAPLYRGDFLEGFAVADSAAFEEWATLHRERLRLDQLALLHQLAVAHEQRKDHAAQVAYGRQILGIEPWSESGHDLVIRGLWATGQRGAALKQYEACRRVLADELGLQPSPELAALAERLRVQSVLDGRAAGAASTSDTDVKTQSGTAGEPGAGHRRSVDVPLPGGLTGDIPAALTPLIGREHELVQLIALLKRDDVRIVTVVGVGGMGKTRLAQELGRVSGTHFSDGVCFVSLTPLVDASALAPAVLVALDEHPTGDAQQALLLSLRSLRMLLILDNFEHLLAGASLVSAIAEAAPGITILATSRERLHVHGEHQFLLNGLAVDPGTDTADDSPALRMFIECARHLQPAFVVDNSNDAAVHRICQIVDGMPLAIELATSWIGMLEPAEIADEITQNLDFLTTEWQDLPPRQRSMRAVFDWSWSLLDESEQHVLQRLAIFRGGFTRNAAQVVAGASLAVLNRLLQKALVKAGEGNRSGRYELHELLRQFALEDLTRDPDDAEATAERHLVFYLGLAERGDRGDRGDRGAPKTESEAWLGDVARDHENIRAALAYSLEPRLPAQIAGGLRGEPIDAKKAELGLRLAGAVWPFWQRHCLFNEGRGWLERLLAGTPEATSLARATALYGAAWLAHDQDDFPSADSFFTAGLALDQDLGQTDRMASVLVHRGIMARGQGQYPEAIALIEAGLKLSRAAGNLAGVAFSLFRLGVVLRECAEYARAAATYNECLVIYRELDDQEGEAFVLLGLADTARDKGDAVGVIASTTAALAIGRALKQPWITGFALNNEALGLLMEGKMELARATSQEALALFRTHDIRGGVVETLITSGMIASASRSDREAKALLEEGIRRGWPAGPHWLVVTGIEELARLDLRVREAALLLAACVAWRAVMGVPVPRFRRSNLETAIAATRHQLGETQFAALWSEGTAMAPEKTVILALDSAVARGSEAMVPLNRNRLPL
jgi:predicted ATPase/DNA-binding SARP family transcriptional activator